MNRRFCIASKRKSVEHRVIVLELCPRKSTVPGTIYETNQIITQA